MTSSSYLANHLLIAMPGLDDPNFSRGVTFLCQHNTDGALGIVHAGAIGIHAIGRW